MISSTLSPQLAVKADIPDLMPQLARLLLSCVEGGASVNFVLPLTYEEALTFCRRTMEGPALEGDKLIFTVYEDDRLAGSVQLVPATQPNQPHRADVSKLLVHPDFRRKGYARSLMQALEAHALSLGLTLLTLDTETGSSAEPLYHSLGFITAGMIPGFCLDTRDPSKLKSTTLMYKQLA